MIYIEPIAKVGKSATCHFDHREKFINIEVLKIPHFVRNDKGVAFAIGSIE